MKSSPFSNGNMGEYTPTGISSSRIYVQLIVFLIGFVFLVSFQYVFSYLGSELRKNERNEYARLQIGDIIVSDIQQIETLIYKFATSRGDKRQSIYHSLLDKRISQLNNALDVLSDGGMVYRLKRLNMIDQERIKQKIVYQATKGDDSNILEIIELRPKIHKIEQIINQLSHLIKQRDYARGGDDQTAYRKIISTVKSQLQEISPLFERTIENANRLFYEGQKHLDQLQQELVERENFYTKLQIVLSLIVIAIVLAVGYLILRQIDISNQKITKMAEELNFQIFALNQHAIVSSTDAEGVITYANERFCEISGYTQQELIGQNHRIVKSKHHSDAFFRDMWKAISAGSVWFGELKNSNKYGEDYWVSATIVPLLDEDLKPFKYIGIRTDITSRKNMEEQINKNHRFLQSMTDAMGEGVYALDVEGTCTFVNREIENLTGWTKEQLMGSDLHEILHSKTIDGDFIPHSECPSHLAIKKGETYQSDTEHFIHKDGHLFPVSIISVPLYENEKIIGSVTVFQDISLRKKTEQAMLEAKLHAEQANQEKSNFLANMSHEIRTPMNAIIGMSYLTLQSDLQPSQRNYIEKVHYSAESLLRILNDILDFSKIEAGKLEIEQIPFDLRKTLDDVQMVLSEKSTPKDIQLVFETADDIPHTLIGDPLRLTQVLLNLGGNALKFTEQGQVLIRVELDGLNDGQAELHFSVQDSGIGISKQQQQQLFNKFSQADTSTTRKYGGTGLGLSISRQLTHLMGGQIWVESEQGSGSTFHFTASFGGSKGLSTERLLSPSRDAEKQLLNLRGAHVLLVEDNALNQELACDLMRNKGMMVVVANNGQDALDILEQEQFDGILMDLQMPVLDGLEATRKIREDARYKHVPIIAMTASTMIGDTEKALAAGMNDYISKPINVQTMFSTMAKWIKSTNMEDVDVIENLPQSGGQFDFSPLRFLAYEDALYRLDGDEKLYVKILQTFVTDHANDLDKILFALSDGDIKQALLINHTVKGISGNLGASQLHQAAQALEECLQGEKADVLDDACSDILDEVDAALKQLLELLSEFLQQTANDADDMPEPSCDVAEMIARLEELQELLASYDARAGQYMTELHQSSFARQHIELFDRLQNKVNQYDFEAASDVLSAIIDALITGITVDE